MAPRWSFQVLDRFASYRRPVMVVLHTILVAAAYLLAFQLRFDFRLPFAEWHRFLTTLPALVAVRMAVFAWFHLYEGLWRYVSMRDILTILKAVTLSSLIFLAGNLVFFGHGSARSVFLLDWVLCLALVGGVRLAFRALRESRRRYSGVGGRRILIVGAGDAGEMLIREIQGNLTLNYEVVGFVDDDPRKHGKRIHGIEVVGTVDQLPELCQTQEVQEILIAMPSATREQARRIIERCRASGVRFKTVPGLDQLLQGKVRIGQLQEVRPEDLLGREPVRLDLDRLRDELQGKRILVTGAGGSIGSELCRQLATFKPERLVLFERAETSLYFVDLELRQAHPQLQVIPVLGDILDRHKAQEVFAAYRPEVVYHAAAYKHVPFMEKHPLDAIQNKIFGTEIVADVACQWGVTKSRFDFHW